MKKLEELKKEKTYVVKYKYVMENNIEVNAENRHEALTKAKELFNSDLKDTVVKPITKFYYVIGINDKDMMVIPKDEQIQG